MKHCFLKSFILSVYFNNSDWVLRPADIWVRVYSCYDKSKDAYVVLNVYFYRGLSVVDIFDDNMYFRHNGLMYSMDVCRTEHKCVTMMISQIIKE